MDLESENAHSAKATMFIVTLWTAQANIGDKTNNESVYRRRKLTWKSTMATTSKMVLKIGDRTTNESEQTRRN